MSDPPSFEAIGGNLALDFVNTVANRRSPEKRRELLMTPADVRGWLAKFELPEGDFRDSEVAVARAIRERLHALFHSAAEGVLVDQAALDAFEDDFHAAGAERRLRQRDDGCIDWDWSPSASALQRSLFPVLVEAATLLVSEDFRRVRECQGPGCGWLFLDRSRGRPRRWCSMRDCGNRAKARRYYHRGPER